MASRYHIYRSILLAEAERLVDAGALSDPEDVFFLDFAEFRDVVATGVVVDHSLIERSRHDQIGYDRLWPPRVLTSDGEAFTSTYPRHGLPPDALVGVAVSSGRVEARARWWRPWSMVAPVGPRCSPEASVPGDDPPHKRCASRSFRR
jgi:pyruvate,water dikinase